jgi:hypothetical protein
MPELSDGTRESPLSKIQSILIPAFLTAIRKSGIEHVDFTNEGIEFDFGKGIFEVVIREKKK